MVRGPGWRRTSHGCYAPVASPGTSLSTAQRIVDCAPLVPVSGAWGGWSAAYVLGADMLDGRSVQGELLPVVVCLDEPGGRRPVPGVRYLRDALPPEDVISCHGLRVTTPMRTALDCASHAPGLVEAVVVLDALGQSGVVRLEAVQQYVERHAGRKHIRQVRAALRLADPAARNPWETRLRCCYVLDAGLPVPMVNQPVFGSDGNLLGIPDIFASEAGLVVEFDGQGHRGRRQHWRDNIREERFEAAGLVVVRVDSLDLLYHRQALVQRLLDGYRRGQLRDRGQDRWTLAEPEWWAAQTDPTADLSDAEMEEIFGG